MNVLYPLKYLYWRLPYWQREIRHWLDYGRISLLMIWDRVRGRKIIIVDAMEPLYISFCLPVVESLNNRDARLSFYASTSAVYINGGAIDLYGVPKRKWINLNQLPYYHLAHIFLSAVIFPQGPKRAKKVYIFHNQPVKYTRYPLKFLNQWDYFFVMGPMQLTYIKNMFLEYGREVADEQFIEVGYPKLDALFEWSGRRDIFLKEMGLDPGRKTVLYAPSWDEGLSLREFGISFINALKQLPHNVIIMLHPGSLVPPEHPRFHHLTGGVSWREVVGELVEPGRVIMPVDENSLKLMIASDLMVTDNSSVAYEFIWLDRPMVFFDCPKFYAETIPKHFQAFGGLTDPDEMRKNPLLNGGRHAGVVAYGETECIALVEEELNNPEHHQTRRLQARETLLYHPGQSAEKAADELMHILHDH
jgi:CDP-glycerol glycerophosphotransferase (TagB/SpsB family)